MLVSAATTFLGRPQSASALLHCTGDAIQRVTVLGTQTTVCVRMRARVCV